MSVFALIVSFVGLLLLGGLFVTVASLQDEVEDLRREAAIGNVIDFEVARAQHPSSRRWSGGDDCA